MTILIRRIYIKSTHLISIQRKKLIFIGLYQVIAISVTTFGLGMASRKESASASWLGIAACLIAMAWNFAFNMAFELWESRQLVKGRSLRRRIAHALGFELGLVAILVPQFAFVLEISFWQSLLLDVGLIAFFLIYAFAFSWSFDRVSDCRIPLSKVLGEHQGMKSTI